MTDAISVLLIIGAAVVGPIDGSARPEGLPPAGYVSCGLSVNCLPAKEAESLSKLCERAMREVGIDTQNKSFLSYAPMWDVAEDGGRRFIQAVGAWERVKTVQDTWAVRCIPTPAGYRR